MGTIYFSQVTFEGYVTFRNASFIKSARFDACYVQRKFVVENTIFSSEVPSFDQAHFSEAPSLSSTTYPTQNCFGGGSAVALGRYRALRRLAIQGHDYENEGKAFKGEIRSKRGTEHKWYHAAFWYGLAYDALSDFGRSMSRPSLIWLLSIAVFAAFYLASAGKLESAFAGCATAGAPNYESALIISWKNALPLIGIDSEAEKIARACLYGGAAYGGIAIQGIQKVWSAVLLFLFLLAVRNQFKIK